MDAERFEKIVLDLVYDELDELTRASAFRHLEQAPRSRALYAELRATREVGALPLTQPDRRLRESIIEGEARARTRLPLRRRLGRTISILAGYAMRPQAAMGVILLLMIGASLLFLRARPGEHDAVHVTERGVAEADVERHSAASTEALGGPADGRDTHQAHGVLRGAAGTPSDDPARLAEERTTNEPASRAEALPPAEEPLPTSDGGAPTPQALYDEGMSALRERRYAEAVRLFDRVSAQPGALSTNAALHAARATLEKDGCGVASTRLQEVRRRASGSPAAHEATWLFAGCQAELSHLEEARRAYESLLSIAEYQAKSRAALARLDNAPSHTAPAPRATVAAPSTPPGAPPTPSADGK